MNQSLRIGICSGFSACADDRADLTFLLDSSGSIRKSNPNNVTDNWEIIKDFVIRTIDSLDVRMDHTRVSVVYFGNEAEVLVDLDYLQNHTIASMKEKIRNLAYLDEKTNTSGALRLMRQAIFRSHKGDRPDIRNVGIIITDGQSNVDQNRTVIEAEAVKQQGIRMFAIGLTSDINEDELRSIASDPVDNHFFTADEIADIETFRTRLIWGVCNENCGYSK